MRGSKDDGMRIYLLKSRYHFIGIVLAVFLIGCACFFNNAIVACFSSSYRTIKVSIGIQQRKWQYGSTVQKRLQSDFHRIECHYPPKKMLLIGFKKERVLEVWVSPSLDTNYKLLRKYPVLGASGHLGPKLTEGDGQVPEGFYKVDWLNPQSLYHLSLHINYPNELDKTEAKSEGRMLLGGDIMIHGGVASVGCIAVGDKAIEDLFILALATGLENIDLILSPVDFRIHKLPPDMPVQKRWVYQLYDSIRSKLPASNLPQGNDEVTQNVKTNASVFHLSTKPVK